MYNYKTPRLGDMNPTQLQETYCIQTATIIILDIRHYQHIFIWHWSYALVAQHSLTKSPSTSFSSVVGIW